MKITIDGKTIEAKEGSSILDAALEAGVYIPHLCSHPDLEAKGGCRLCSVEIDGVEGAVPSCMTKVEEGMNITINGPEADKVRKMAMELILASHPADCTGCPKFGKCELQSLYQYLGVSAERWRKKSRSVPNDDSNPLISHLFTRCIRCGRCIRACQDLRGVKVLDYVKTKDGIRAGIASGTSLKDAGCRFCGACIEVCPTGSIVDQLKMMNPEKSYMENVVPCKANCPAHIDIPQYIRAIKEGDFDKATAIIREKVPFPEVLGSVCTHVCESNCKRNELGEPISICKLKRAAATQDSGVWKEKVHKEPATGKKVAVIGAGPSGLTAAYYLAKKGHAVTVFEKNEKAGGQCRYGIPSYRLPDDLLDREIANILEIGIELKTNSDCQNLEELKQQYDAVLVSIGTHQGTKLPIPGNDLPGVYVNTEFLKDARSDNAIQLGEKVMVLGGGNVAYDCARTAIRKGAKEVHIACLENQQQMTSSPDEIEEGAQEGVILHAAHSFLRITGEDKVTGVELKKVNRFYFDENRKAVLDLEEGSEHVIEVDNVIFAVGQKPMGTDTMNLDLTHGPYIAANNAHTSMEGVFASGDVVTGTRSVIQAIVGGREAAEQMDIYLGGNGDISEQLVERTTPNPCIGQVEGFADLARVNPDMISLEERCAGFTPVEKPLTCDQAKCEAGRCLQCDLRLNISNVKLWNEY
ncbi:FAD-dependent oxidoreductase [uncultured Holdemanella sp.]|uniref:FAD-dependent oxidoreductase n=1 Tax=uncultured Holdemanella sp. TaxID=1763549 RepID=UPI0025EB236D|nr:FAD-dependent oxidoreductase [uncultured Holdemanella sp.]